MFSRKKVLIYTIPFVLTLAIQSIIYLLYINGYGTPFYENQFDITFIIINSIASLSMFHYLIKKFKNNCSIFYTVIFAISYGLCSYALIQQKTISQGVIFALFPLLYLYYQEMYEKKECYKYAILLALFMSLNIITSLGIVSILFVLLVIKSVIERTRFLSRAVYFLCTSIISLALSAFFSFPQIYDLYNINKEIIYPGFQEYTPISILLSKSLFGSVSSLALNQTNGLNLFFGTFPLLCLFAYFINKTIQKRDKIFVLLSILVCAIILNYSPISYLVSLKSSVISPINPISFVPVFFLLIVAYRGALQLIVENRRQLVQSLISFIGYSFLILILTKHNFSPLSIMTCIILSISYALICFSSRNKKGFFPLLLIICIIELSANAFLTSFAEFIPSTVSNQSILSKIDFSFLDDSEGNETTTNTDYNLTTKSDDAEELYNTFIEQHHDKDLYTMLDKLDMYCSLELGIDSSEYTDLMEKYNYLVHSIGFETDLFTASSISSVSFENSQNYQIIDQGHNIFHLIGTPKPTELEYAYAEYTLTPHDSDMYILNNNDTAILHFEASNHDTKGFICLPISPYYGFNFHMNICTLNETAYMQLVSFISNAKISTTTNTSMIPYYIGLVISAISLSLYIIIFMMKKKGNISKNLFQITESFSTQKVFVLISSWIKRNKIYLLAFAFPFCSFVFYMIIFNIAPFGTATLWDGDGALSVFPYLYDASKQMQNGIFTFSPNQGYGNSIFARPLYYYIIALFIKAEYFLTAYHWILATLLGIASVSMVFYIKNRYTKTSSYTDNEYLALLPAIIYSLNSYMFTMHAYFMWFILIAFLPILIWSLERLIYEKKALLYTVILSLFMCTEIQLSYYICIYLCIVFLCASHKNIKEFFLSGIRFSIYSILAACNSFIFISGMFFSKNQSGYVTSDSIHPSFGFFGSYLDIFAHQMPFNNLESVTQDNTNISLFVSIICIILALLFTLNRSICVKERIKRLIPIVILYFTFNEQISAYVINGFHYQTLVPNRHAFLVIFPLAVMAYDGLASIKKNTFSEIIIVLCSCFALFALCAIFSEKTNNLCTISTFVAIVLYSCILIFGKKLEKKYIQNILVIMCGISLFANGLYTSACYNLYGMNLFGNYKEIADYIDTTLDLDNNNYRVSFIASPLANTGMVYGVSSTDLFQSCISNDILKYHSLFGGTTGTNFARNTYASTPVNNSLFAIKYIFYPVSSIVEEKDLDNYNYISCKNNYYVLENPHAAPLMYNVPFETKDYISVPYSPIDINELVKTIQPQCDDIYDLQYISYDQDNKRDNTYTFYSSNHQVLTSDEAISFHDMVTDPTMRSDDYYVRINIIPEQTGYAYFYAGEYIPLGYLNANTNYTFDIYGPKLIETEKYIFFTINKETENNLYNYLIQNQLSDVKIQDNILSGISNSKDECYTQIMAPYNTNWKAYIDDVEVPIETNSNSIMYIKTPSGKHTVKLVYTYSFSPATIISLAGWIFTLLLSVIVFIKKFRQKKK